MRAPATFAVGVCALAAGLQEPQPYTRESFFEHAMRTKAAALGNEKLVRDVCDSVFTYVTDNAFGHDQEALAIALTFDIASEGLRCRHDIPWMYGILALVTKTDKDWSENTNLIHFFKTFDGRCVSKSIYADGPTPIDAVLLNSGSVTKNNIPLTIKLLQSVNAADSVAPTLTLNLVKLALSQSVMQSPFPLVNGLFTELSSVASEGHSSSLFATSTNAAVNPALVLNLACMYNYGTTIPYVKRNAYEIDRSFLKQEALGDLLDKAYNLLQDKGKRLVDSALPTLGLSGLKSVSNEINLASVTNAMTAFKNTSNGRTVGAPLEIDRSAYLRLFTSEFNESVIKAFQPSAAKTLNLWHDGQFSLYDYTLVLAAEASTDELENVIKMLKTRTIDISPKAWDMVMKISDFSHLQSYLCPDNQDERQLSEIQNEFHAFDRRLYRAGKNARKFYQVLNDAQCTIRSNTMLPEYAMKRDYNHCEISSDKTSVIERMHDYYATVRNPLWVLSPITQFHWPGAYWLHDKGCFFHVYGPRLAVYFAVVTMWLLLVTRSIISISRHLADRRKARYALPRPANE